MTLRDLTPWRWGETRARRPHDPFLPMLEPVERLLEEAFGRPVAEHGNGMLAPRIDVSEDEKGYRFVAELPGVEAEQLNVTVSDGVLTIKGEKQTETKEEKEHMLWTERRFGSFERAFSLPADADESKVDADFDKGVLTLTVAKKEATEPATKRIAVKTH